MSTTPTAPLSPLTRSDFRAQAREALRASIVTGELEPGELYTVGAFAARLNVSATPVREALGDLAQVGLVQVVRNRGFIVPSLTDEDLAEILRLRLFLEVPAIEEIAGRLPADEIAVCQELVDRSRIAGTGGNLTDFLAADREFHLRLVGGLGNRRLVQILEQLRDETRLYGLRALAQSGKLASSADEHQAILDAVAAGDPVRARDAITAHLLHTRGSWAGKTEDDD